MNLFSDHELDINDDLFDIHEHLKNQPPELIESICDQYNLDQAMVNNIYGHFLQTEERYQAAAKNFISIVSENPVSAFSKAQLGSIIGINISSVKKHFKDKSGSVRWDMMADMFHAFYIRGNRYPETNLEISFHRHFVNGSGHLMKQYNERLKKLHLDFLPYDLGKKAYLDALCRRFNFKQEKLIDVLIYFERNNQKLGSIYSALLDKVEQELHFVILPNYLIRDFGVQGRSLDKWFKDKNNETRWDLFIRLLQDTFYSERFYERTHHPINLNAHFLKGTTTMVSTIPKQIQIISSIIRADKDLYLQAQSICDIYHCSLAGLIRGLLFFEKHADKLRIAAEDMKQHCSKTDFKFTSEFFSAQKYMAEHHVGRHFRTIDGRINWSLFFCLLSDVAKVDLEAHFSPPIPVIKYKCKSKLKNAIHEAVKIHFEENPDADFINLASFVKASGKALLKGARKLYKEKHTELVNWHALAKDLYTRDESLKHKIIANGKSAHRIINKPLATQFDYLVSKIYFKLDLEPYTLITRTWLRKNFSDYIEYHEEQGRSFDDLLKALYEHLPQDLKEKWRDYKDLAIDFDSSIELEEHELLLFMARIDYNMSARMGKCLGRSFDGNWLNYVPYSLCDLAQRLINQCKDGMHPNNYGTYWSIDHVIPISANTKKTRKNPMFDAIWKSLDNFNAVTLSDNAAKNNYMIELTAEGSKKIRATDF